MFYKTCLAIALGIVTLGLIGAFNSASSVTLRQQNFVDARAQRYSRTPYIVPIPYNRGYSSGGSRINSGGSGNSGSSGSSGSSRSDYGGYRGGGPGTGK